MPPSEIPTTGALHPDFPRTPWASPARNRAAKVWRKKSEESIGYVLETIGCNEIGSYNTVHWQHNTVDQIIKALFLDFPQANPMDRIDLLHWLGRASAIGSEATTTFGRARETVVTVTGLLLDRWAASGWLSVAYKDRPAWAGEFLDEITRGGGAEVGLHDEWGSIVPERGPRTGVNGSNAQADLRTFLDGYACQSQVSGAPLSVQNPTSPIGRKIVECCLALRILASSTEAVEPEALRLLKIFEDRYDHMHVSQELLRMAEAAGDLKLLRAEGEESGMDHTGQRSTRVRKL